MMIVTWQDYDPENYRSPNLEKMIERRNSSLSPRALTRKFQSFQQRKLIGTQWVFPAKNLPVRESKGRPKKSGKYRYVTLPSDESMVALDQVIAGMPNFSKGILTGRTAKKSDVVKMNLVRTVREKGKARKLNCLGRVSTTDRDFMLKTQA